MVAEEGRLTARYLVCCLIFTLFSLVKSCRRHVGRPLQRTVPPSTYGTDGELRMLCTIKWRRSILAACCCRASNQLDISKVLVSTEYLPTLLTPIWSCLSLLGSQADSPPTRSTRALPPADSSRIHHIPFALAPG